MEEMNEPKWETFDPDPEATFVAKLEAAPRPLTEDVIDDLIKAWYAIEDNVVGGSLHVVLDDGNWKREHVEFCRGWAKERGDAPGEAFATALLTLTDEQLRAWLGSDDDHMEPVPPAGQVDLDELERKARAAEQDEWQWRPASDDVLEGVHQGQVVLAGEELLCSVSDRAHIAANGPPVTLALIARIRELEAALRAAAGGIGVSAPTSESEARADAELSDRCHEILEKGVVLT